MGFSLCFITPARARSMTPPKPKGYRWGLRDQANVDQSKSLEDYVSAEYIGTPGCFSSSGFCG